MTAGIRGCSYDARQTMCETKIMHNPAFTISLFGLLNTMAYDAYKQSS